MALLSFKVQADYEEAIKCQQEVERLQKALDKVSVSGTAAEMEKLSDELQIAKIRLSDLVTEASKTGEELETAFVSNITRIKKDMNEASLEYKQAISQLQEDRKVIEEIEAKIKDASARKDFSKVAELNKLKDERNKSIFEQKDIIETSSARMTSLDQEAKQLYREYNLINSSLDVMSGNNALSDIERGMKSSNDAAREFKSIFNSIAEQATGVAIGNILAGGLDGAVDKMINFKDQILETRKYFQDVESSMTIFLGSAEKAADFTGKLEKAAYYNMFDYEQLVGASKQLIAYGNDIDTVIPTINKLSEIATGTGNSVNNLVDMYNRAKSIGYVDSRSLQTWASQGIVVKDILKQMGETSVGTRVTFEQLNKAIDYITQEGQMFGGVMDAQMENLSASMGQLEDNISLMKNEIGESLQGVFKSQIDLQAKLVEHWKEIAKVIGGVVIAYGVFKGAMIANIALHKAENVLMDAAIKLNKKNAAAKIADAAAGNLQTFSLKNTIAALKMYTVEALKAAAATLTNPYVLVAAALAVVAVAIYKEVTALSEEEKAHQRVADAMDDRTKALKDLTTEERQLSEIVSNENSTERERIKAYERLGEILPELTEKYTEFQLAQMTPEERQKAIEEAQKKQAQSEDEAIKSAAKSVKDISSVKEKINKNADSGAFNSFAGVGTKGYTQEEFNKIQEAYNKVFNAMHLSEEKRLHGAGEMLEFIRQASTATEEANKKEAEQEEIIRRRGLALQEQLELEEKDLRALNHKKKALDRFAGTLENSDELTETLRKRMLTLAKDASPEIQVKLKEAKTPEEAAKIFEEYINSVTDKVNKKQKQVNSVKSDITSIATQTPSKQRADALKKKILLENVQRKMMHGNYDFSDEELEACGVNLKDNSQSSEFGKLVSNAKTNGGINAGNLSTFSEKIGTELSNVQSDLKNTGYELLQKEQQEAYKLAEQRRKNTRDITRAAADAILEARQAEIDAEISSSVKLTKQRTLDFDKEMQRLEREKEDKVRAAEETARAVWMAENPEYNKEYQWDAVKDKYLNGANQAARDYQKAVSTANMNFATGVTKATNKKYNIGDIYDSFRTDSSYFKEYNDLTDKMNRLDEARKQLLDNRDVHLLSDDEQNRLAQINEAMDGLMRKRNSLMTETEKNKLDFDEQYGDFYQRRQAIYTKYQKQIEATNDENLKKTLSNKRDEEIQKLPKAYVDDRIKDLKDDKNYAQVFSDIKYATNEQMENVRKELKKLLLNDEIKSNPEAIEAIEKYLQDIDVKLLQSGGFKDFLTYYKDARTKEKTAAEAEKKARQARKNGDANAEELERQAKMLKKDSDETNEVLTEEIEKLCDTIQDLGGQLDKIGQQIGGNFGNGLSAMGGIMSTLGSSYMSGVDLKNKVKEGDVGKGAGTAMGIMQGISAGISVGSTLTNYLESVTNTGDNKYQKYAEKLAKVNQLTHAVEAYQMAVLMAQQAEDSWFGKDPLRDLGNSWEVAAKSKDDYFSQLNEQKAKYRNKSKHDGDWLGNVLVGSTAGAIAGFAVGNFVGAIVGGIAGGVAGVATSSIEQMLGNSDYKKDAVSARDNLRIETRSRKKSFMWIGGHDQKTASLEGWAREKFGDELFDADGWVNVDLANNIMENFGDKLVGQTEETLQKLVELKEQYDEYKEQLRDYVNSLYSPLVDNMTKAMWDWFDEGRDALQSFKNYASDVFRSIMDDMLQKIVLSKVVGTFQDDIEELYDSYFSKAITEEQLMAQIASRTTEMMNNYEEQIPILQSMMEGMSGIIENSTGIDIHNRSNGSATSGMQASFSQDSIDEANGRMASIQMMQQLEYMAITEIDSNVAELLYANRESNNYIQGIQQQLAESYMELQGVHEDTTAIKTAINNMLNNYISKWDVNIKEM